MKILIASSVRQKKNILEQFLLSLYELNHHDLEIDYAFVDDNDDINSSNLLEKFQPLNSRVWLFKTGQDREPYICDQAMHYWNNRLISRVAEYKDLIIKHSLTYQYDYLLLVDSDLLLHPVTLTHLLSCQKDIISEVFWTRWTNTHELPNVWLADEYRLYNMERGEIIDKSEEDLRSMQFLNQLRKPGIYKVGGLGACTLISRQALMAGVSFKEIYNLSFQGEDRHFCIRAAALGLELFADTHYPCYHIYRDSDLRGIATFLRSIPYHLSKNHSDTRFHDQITDV